MKNILLRLEIIGLVQKYRGKTTIKNYTKILHFKTKDNKNFVCLVVQILLRGRIRHFNSTNEVSLFIKSEKNILEKIELKQRKQQKESFKFTANNKISFRIGTIIRNNQFPIKLLRNQLFNIYLL